MQDLLVKSENAVKTLDSSECFAKNAIDCFEEGNNLWFKLSDIAKVLEVGRSTASMWKTWADEDEIVFKKIEHSKNPAPYGSESLLYRILNRSNSPKAKPFERWVTKVVIPSIRKTGKYVAPTAPVKSAEEMQFMRDKLEKERREVDLERARFLRSMSLSYSGKSETFPQILDAYAVHEIVGTFALPLPEIKQRLMSAEEVGKILGISAHKVGLLANKHGVKVEAYGSWVRDKSRYSSKEVDTFRYNNEGLEKIRQIALEEETK